MGESTKLINMKEQDIDDIERQNSSISSNIQNNNQQSKNNQNKQFQLKQIQQSDQQQQKQRYQEPETHRQNKSTWEYIFSSCMGHSYDLDSNEIIQFNMLKEESIELFSQNNQTHIMILSELWELLTESIMDKENYKNEEWIKYGFQNTNPCSDFRGGGVQSLLQIINFVKNNRNLVINQMSNPQNDFFFAISSINVTFFLKQVFHLADHLDPKKDKNVFCNRQGLKSFCQMLCKDDNAFNILHDIVLKDMFVSWIHLRKTQPQTSLIDFPQIEHQFKKKFRMVLQKQEYYDIVEFQRVFNLTK